MGRLVAIYGIYLSWKTGQHILMLLIQALQVLNCNGCLARPGPLSDPLEALIRRYLQIQNGVRHAVRIIVIVLEQLLS